MAVNIPLIPTLDPEKVALIEALAYWEIRRSSKPALVRRLIENGCHPRVANAAVDRVLRRPAS